MSSASTTTAASAGAPVSQDVLDKLSKAPGIGIRPELRQHSKEWEKGEEIVELCKGKILIASGYDIANSIAIVTAGGLVIIDALTDATKARQVCQQFKERSGCRRIKAIILTHNHGDHVLGVAGLLEDQPEDAPLPRIIAHEDCKPSMKRVWTTVAQCMAKRNPFQFAIPVASSLPRALVEEKGWFANAGIGPFVSGGHKHDAGMSAQPRHTFVPFDQVEWITGDTWLEEEGLKILVAPGETDDQLMVWWTAERVLFCADNFYRAYPNLYAIRGTAARDAEQWIHTLDLMRQLRPACLVGSHCQPVTGGPERVCRLLTHYRDTVALTHDQTVRLMNKGHCPDDAVLYVDGIINKARSLMAQLDDEDERRLAMDYTAEYYGMAEWSIRSIFAHYVGWFNGDPAYLFPATPATRGTLLLRMTHALAQSARYSSPLVDEQSTTTYQYVLERITAFMERVVREVEHEMSGKATESGCYGNAIAHPDERFVLETTAAVLAVLCEDEPFIDSEVHLEREAHWIALTSDQRHHCCRKMKRLRWQVMRNIASRSWSSNGRNYLISRWLQEEYGLVPVPSPAPEATQFGEHLPIGWLIESLRYKVNPVVALNDLDATGSGSVQRVCFDIAEVGLFGLELRSMTGMSVLQTTQFPLASVASSQSTGKDEKSACMSVDEFKELSSVIYELTDKQWREGGFHQYIAKGDVEEHRQFWKHFDLLDDKCTMPFPNHLFSKL